MCGRTVRSSNNILGTVHCQSLSTDSGYPTRYPAPTRSPTLEDMQPTTTEVYHTIRVGHLSHGLLFSSCPRPCCSAAILEYPPLWVYSNHTRPVSMLSPLPTQYRSSSSAVHRAQSPEGTTRQTTPPHTARTTPDNRTQSHPDHPGRQGPENFRIRSTSTTTSRRSVRLALSMFDVWYRVVCCVLCGEWRIDRIPEHGLSTAVPVSGRLVG